MWIKVFIIVLLVVIFVQDIKSRSVSWILFPILAASFIVFRLSFQSLNTVLMSVGTCLSLVGIQLLMVTAWFSIRQGKWVNITTSLLGWGDILFLVAVAAGLSLLNFLLFYIFSLVFIAVYGIINYRPDKQIPLAGLQALILTLILGADWWYLHLDLSDDSSVINLLFS